MVTVAMASRGNVRVGLGALCAAFVLLLGIAAPATAAPALAVQADGKVLVGGVTSHGFGYLARLGADGSLDPGFGVGGVVVDHRLGGVSALATQPDGKVLAAADGGLARYENDGSVDSSFGSAGLARIGFYPNLSYSLFYPRWVSSLRVLPDGRIAVGGTNRVKTVPSSGLVLIVSPGGDQEWAGGTGTDTTLTAMVARADGSLITTGNEESTGKGLLARFLPGGGLDFAFGGGAGLVKFSPGPVGSPMPTPSAIVADGGGLLVGGVLGGQLLLARFSDQGVLSKGFGNEGFAIVGQGGLNRADELAIQPDGRILTAGGGLLARFLSNGGPDASFGQAGVARIPAGPAPTNGTSGDDLALLPDGRILTAGYAGASAAVLGRFSGNGAADAGFGSGGVATVDPCVGGKALLRQRGCEPSARVSLRLRHKRRGASGLSLRVRPAEDWANVRSLWIRLPGSLRVRSAAAGAVSFTYLNRKGEKRRMLAGAGAHGLRFRAPGAWGGSRVSLDLPGRFLRQVGQPAARLRFRLQVEFTAGYRSQKLVLSRAG